jgi:hypothetical protein
MAEQFALAVGRFVTGCPYVVAVHDLVTKTRIELEKGHVLDLYYNAALQKYAYTLIYADRRVLGWDNAPHHPDLPNPPHHFHHPDGSVESSALTGDPAYDIEIVLITINAHLGS